jgi:hypothetical protein
MHIAFKEADRSFLYPHGMGALPLIGTGSYDNYAAVQYASVTCM